MVLFVATRQALRTSVTRYDIESYIVCLLDWCADAQHNEAEQASCSRKEAHLVMGQELEFPEDLWSLGRFDRTDFAR
jgi:hypothetical protein